MIKMAKAKKITAALTAALMCAGTLTGCSDTSYAMTVGSDKVNAGIYIYNILSEMSYQMTMMYYQDGVTKDYFDQKVDGKDFADYLSDYALTATKEYAAVVDKFNELGLELSEDDLKEVNDTVNDTWESQGDFYEAEGISKESVKLAQKASKMRDMLFDYYYAEGGEEAVSDDEMVKYIDDNYLRYKSISISKSSSEDSSSQSAEDDKAKATRDEFLDKAQGVSFEDFDSIIDEYNDYVAAQSAEDNSSTAVSDSSGVSDDTSSVSESDTDSSSVSDDMLSVSDSTVSDDSAADSEAVSDSESVVDVSTADDSTADSSSEPDPYANENMYNYGAMDDEQKDSTSGKLMTEIEKLETDVATAYEDDNAYYILIRGDITERDKEYAEENHDNLLGEMKSDEFQEKITSWVEKLKITVNSKAIKRYTPKAVYDKQTEYYEKNRTT